jgi:hypothetical protein
MVRWGMSESSRATLYCKFSALPISMLPVKKIHFGSVSGAFISYLLFPALLNPPLGLIGPTICRLLSYSEAPPSSSCGSGSAYINSTPPGTAFADIPFEKSNNENEFS